ncbi:MAG: aldo/keto reductase [Saprospiraceae bacterium]|nr:aldo/keto reductase [Candidatus Brachybacter algidus]
MIYRTLGKTNKQVSVIGLGTWQFGGEWGIDYTQSMVDDIMEESERCGITLVDTAECYGDHLSEKFIGDYFSRNGRERWFLATKFGHKFHDFLSRTDVFQADKVVEQLDLSLRALKTDYIDLYQFHSGPDDAFRNDKLWTLLDKQISAGKIRHLGCSLNKTTQIQAEEASQYGIDVIQILYNRLDRSAEQRHLPAAIKDNLGVLARVPLASGLLSGKYNLKSTFPDNDVRSKQSANQLKEQLVEVEKIRNEEVPSGVPMSQWAMAWCLDQPGVTAVIPGCKNPEQVRMNAEAADLLKE